jgi:hypothetical protein
LPDGSAMAAVDTINPINRANNFFIILLLTNYLSYL